MKATAPLCDSTSTELVSSFFASRRRLHANGQFALAICLFMFEGANSSESRNDHPNPVEPFRQSLMRFSTNFSFFCFFLFWSFFGQIGHLWLMQFILKWNDRFPFRMRTDGNDHAVADWFDDGWIDFWLMTTMKVVGLWVREREGEKKRQQSGGVTN